jgi:hypothetical protein
MCGRVKMRITQAPMIAMACHCRGCQKLTSGPYSLTLMLEKAGFEVEGETEIGALHKPEMQHHFCAHCKNWLYSDGDLMGPRVNFRATMLDDASWVVPFVESNIAEKLPGVVSGARHSFQGFPPPDQYAPLTQEFAAEGAHPA